MPAPKFQHATMSADTANKPTESSKPGAMSPWGGPPGSKPIQPRYIPPRQAANR